MSQPPQQTSTPSPRRSLVDRRGRERRVLAVGLAVSAVLHLVALFVVGGWLSPDGSRPTDEAPSSPMVLEPPSGMRVVDVTVTVDEAEAEPPDQPEPPDRPDPEPREEPPVVATEAALDSLAADRLTAADRLAVRVVDPRLWQPMILIPREPTIEDVEARIGAAVELLSDSALAEADAAMRARDWTVEDSKGGKWGVSPGQLHLGNVTLPLPIWFPQDPDAVAAEALWYELDQQLERSRIRDSFRDRVRAIRERRERERAEAKKAENGGG